MGKKLFDFLDGPMGDEVFGHGFYDNRKSEAETAPQDLEFLQAQFYSQIVSRTKRDPQELIDEATELAMAELGLTTENYFSVDDSTRIQLGDFIQKHISILMSKGES